ncbi:transposable element Tcb1 transposase [Trichonephila clavipes]|nr:transposable element Tcb1 transposase [Trichonephila clavipes]
MVWSAIEYTSRSSLIRTNSNLNRVRYISGALRPVSLPFIRTLANPTFQQDNTRQPVVGIVRTFYYTKNVRLLP